MILTHESGSQEDQFDEKKWRQKISWDYPFKPLKLVFCSLKSKFPLILKIKYQRFNGNGRPLD
jgi:hypothetical protein